MAFLIALAVLGGLVVAAPVLAFVRLRRPPANAPEAIARRPPTRPRALIVGASTIHGNVSFNIVDELARRLPGYEFVNGGINGNTARQALDRSAAMLACAPDVVIVLVGGNDLLAIRQSPMAQRPPGEAPPSIEDYRRDLTALIEHLRDGVRRDRPGARFALCTLPIAGERLDSAINADVDRMNTVIAEVAAATGATLLPVNSRIRDLLPTPAGKDLPDGPGLVVRGIVLRLGFGLPLAVIARLNGFRVLTDGLHLGPVAGRTAADELARFITDRPA